MSYSRWTSSFWYTYWKNKKDISNIKKETFVISDFAHTIEYTYEDLKKNLENSLNEIKNEYNKEKDIEILTEEKKIGDKLFRKYENIKCFPTNIDKNLIEELKIYIQMFIEEVELKYKT